MAKGQKWKKYRDIINRSGKPWVKSLPKILLDTLIQVTIFGSHLITQDED